MSAPLRLRLAVFDCDGTLVDSQRMIVAAMAAAWRACGIEPPAARAVRRVVGLPLAEAVAKLLPQGTPKDVEKLSRHYRAAFFELSEHPDRQEILYPGVRDVLDALEERNYLLGIATGKSRRGLDATLARHGLSGRFVTLQTGDQGPGKPNPDMLLRAMAETGAGADGTVMIGDTSFDMLMARSAGAVAIGVSWGYHDPRELLQAGAQLVIESFEELPSVLDSLSRRRKG